MGKGLHQDTGQGGSRFGKDKAPLQETAQSMATRPGSLGREGAAVPKRTKVAGVKF